MNRFTIKDIENLTAIKAHTWRVWEQRFGIGIPQRKDSNHRFYDNENLKQILRIAYLYHNGIKISKIALFDSEQLRSKAHGLILNEHTNEYYISELLEAAIDLDEERFEQIFREAVQRLGIDDTIVNVSYPFQARIGVLWLTDHVIPSQEHFTSNIIRQKIAVAINNLPLVKNTAKKDILIFTPEKEQHELPLQFIHYLMKKNGNNVIYFGSNVCLDHIQSYSQYKSFNYLLFHLVTNFTSKSADEYLLEVSKKFPDKNIIMSGCMVQQVTAVPPNVLLLKSMQEIIDFAAL